MTISTFKGLNTSISPEDLDSAFCQAGSQNAMTDRILGTIKSWYGFENKTNMTLPVIAGAWIKSIHNYKDRMLLIEYGNAGWAASALYVWHVEDTAPVLLSGYTWNKYYKIRSVIHEDKLYLFNGFDRLRYFDGTQIKEIKANVVGYKAPIGKFGAMHVERLFLSDGYALWFSNLNDPSVTTKTPVKPYQIKAWSQDNGIYMNNRELITGLLAWNGKLILTQWKGLYVLEGISPVTFRKIDIESSKLQNIGCVSGDTLIAKEDFFYGVDNNCTWASDGKVVKDITTLSIRPTFVTVGTHVPQPAGANYTDVSEFEKCTLDTITPYDNYGIAEIINMHRAGVKYDSSPGFPEAESRDDVEHWFHSWNKWIQEAGYGAEIHAFYDVENMSDNNIASSANLFTNDPTPGYSFNDGDIIEIGYTWDEQVLCEDGTYPKKWLLLAKFGAGSVKDDKIYVHVRSALGAWSIYKIADTSNIGDFESDPLVLKTNLINLSAHHGDIYGIKIRFKLAAGVLNWVGICELVPYTDATDKGLKIPTNLSYVKLLQANMWAGCNILQNKAYDFPKGSEKSNAVASYAPTKPAYIGWVWEKRDDNHNYLKIKKVFLHYKIDTLAGRTIKLEYKNISGNWIDTGHTFTLDIETSQDYTFATSTEIRGIRIWASKSSTTEDFTIYGLYCRDGIITTANTYLGNIYDPVFRANYVLSSSDKASWLPRAGTFEGTVTYEIKGADTEAGLPAAPWVNITSGQSLADVDITTYKWIVLRASISNSTGGIYNFSYPQIDEIAIDGFLNGHLYNEPYGIRFEERLKWGFPDKDSSSYFLVSNREQNWMLRTDRVHHTKLTTLNEKLYGARNDTGNTNKIVLWNENLYTDDGVAIPVIWKTKDFTPPSNAQQVEAKECYIVVNNHETVLPLKTLTITDSALSHTETITLDDNTEKMYAFNWKFGTVADKINFIIGYSGDIDIKSFAVGMEELVLKPF